VNNNSLQAMQVFLFLVVLSFTCVGIEGCFHEVYLGYYYFHKSVLFMISSKLKNVEIKIVFCNIALKSSHYSC